MRDHDVWRPLRRLMYGLVAVALVVFVVGTVFTDRYEWSQWLWWIPRTILAVVALPGATVATFRPGRAKLVALAGAVPIVAFAYQDIGWRSWDPRLSGLHVIHWNASWPGSAAGALPARLLLQRDADVLIISNAYKLLGDGRDDEWVAHGYELVNTGTFLVASRWPLIEARNIGGTDGRVLGVIRLDIRGERFTMYAVDLPSDTRLSRMQIANAFASEARLPSCQEADLVVGDFNISRGSHSLERMFPGARNAFDLAGVGFGATWPRRLPLLQLDQMLVGERIEPIQYRIFDLGSRVHRAQEVIAQSRK